MPGELGVIVTERLRPPMVLSASSGTRTQTVSIPPALHAQRFTNMERMSSSSIGSATRSESAHCHPAIGRFHAADCTCF
jgi:hypothetical protein